MTSTCSEMRREGEEEEEEEEEVTCVDKTQHDLASSGSTRDLREKHLTKPVVDAKHSQGYIGSD